MSALSRHARVRALALAAAASWSGAAAACPVCFASRGAANREAFVETTVFLSALPLLLVGLFVWWVLRRARHHDLPSPHGSTEPACVNEDAPAVD